jgi:hypothetical protein
VGGAGLRLGRRQNTENKRLKMSIFFIRSAVAVTKSKYQSQTNVENEMHVAVATLLPRFDVLSYSVIATSTPVSLND